MIYDYIIVGSGFGGSVSALRLAQKGYKVLVIEKGKWYKADDFPKTNWNLRRWIWLPKLRFFGIMKVSFFRHITILSGAGVGGGSLVYGNTLPVPKSRFYNTGSWKDLANWESELAPFYNIALKMLGATKNPKLFIGDKTLEKVANKLDIKDQFSPTKVAVFFGKENITVPDPYFDGKGPDRKGCNYCGACMTGCRNNSKNTLDKNYLYLAQNEGAKIHAEEEVILVQPTKMNNESIYEVMTRKSTAFLSNKKTYQARGIIFAGGVLGTVKLLLSLKKKTLPNLSERLGHDIRTNNETLLSVSSLEEKADYSRGVAIGSILHTDENTHLEICRYGKGSNAWKLLHFPYAQGNNVLVRFTRIFSNFASSPIKYLKTYLKNEWAKKTVVLLFMQTLDSTIQFKKGFFGGMTSRMSKGKKPTPFIPESIELLNQYSEANQGVKSSFILETLAGIPSTAHILGGAVMGKDINHGVIDEKNRVYGYENMYIIDGSMISANPGVNPSLSITAIAERAMSFIENKSFKKEQV